MRQTITIVALLLAPAAGAGPGQGSAIAYSAAQLQSARFHETGEATIQTESGGRSRLQKSERRGYWQFRATSLDGEIALEAWLDSLTITRRSDQTTISPDTDGLLGGRYRGVLSPTGAYDAAARPFVPDGVAEMADMATALDDFFPPLPPGELAVGKSWTDSNGLTITRLADSSVSGVSLLRFELERRQETRVRARRGDSLAIPRRQMSEEHGTFLWHPALGLLRRDRQISIETTIPVSRTVRQPVRSRVEQRITVARDLGGGQ